MSFLYPHAISIARPSGTLSQGADGASMGSTVVAASVACTIQLKRDKGLSAPAGFQGGATNTSAPMPEMMIYIPSSSGLGQGAVRPGDVITDLATGDQYKADIPSWSPMGWKISCAPYRPNA